VIRLIDRPLCNRRNEGSAFTVTVSHSKPATIKSTFEGKPERNDA
jgi:hypothetical protein